MPHPEIEQNVQELIFPVENLPEQEPQNFEGKLGLSQCPRLLVLAADSEFELEYQFSLKRDSRKVLIEKKLCSTSCKGLCQRCGVNLNTQSCLCNEEIEDHPFAVLKGIGSEFENFQK